MERSNQHNQLARHSETKKAIYELKSKFFEEKMKSIINDSGQRRKEWIEKLKKKETERSADPESETMLLMYGNRGAIQMTVKEFYELQEGKKGLIFREQFNGLKGFEEYQTQLRIETSVVDIDTIDKLKKRLLRVDRKKRPITQFLMVNNDDASHDMKSLMRSIEKKSIELKNGNSGQSLIKSSVKSEDEVKKLSDDLYNIHLGNQWGINLKKDVSDVHLNEQRQPRLIETTNDEVEIKEVDEKEESDVEVTEMETTEQEEVKIGSVPDTKMENTTEQPKEEKSNLKYEFYSIPISSMSESLLKYFPIDSYKMGVAHVAYRKSNFESLMRFPIVRFPHYVSGLTVHFFCQETQTHFDIFQEMLITMEAEKAIVIPREINENLKSSRVDLLVKKLQETLQKAPISEDESVRLLDGLHFHMINSSGVNTPDVFGKEVRDDDPNWGMYGIGNVKELYKYLASESLQERMQALTTIYAFGSTVSIDNVLIKDEWKSLNRLKEDVRCDYMEGRLKLEDMMTSELQRLCSSEWSYVPNTQSAYKKKNINLFPEEHLRSCGEFLYFWTTNFLRTFQRQLLEYIPLDVIPAESRAALMTPMPLVSQEQIQSFKDTDGWFVTTLKECCIWRAIMCEVREKLLSIDLSKPLKSKIKQAKKLKVSIDKALYEKTEREIGREMSFFPTQREATILVDFALRNPFTTHPEDYDILIFMIDTPLLDERVVQEMINEKLITKDEVEQTSKKSNEVLTILKGRMIKRNN
jgi:hypothetical protein